MDIKKYIVDGDDSEVFAISLVEEPAVESDYIALAKEKQQIMLKDEKRHMVYGCALRADFPIYRYSPEYGEYYIEFTKEAISKIARRFMKDGYLQNFTADHEKDAEGIYVAESWIKESEEFDKSKALGIGDDCAIGSWFIGAYVDSNDLWRKVESGEWNGFSVEAFVGLTPEELTKQTPKEEKLEEVAPTPEPVVANPEPAVEPEPSPEPPPVPTEEVKPEPVVEQPKVEQPKQDNDIAEVIKSLKAEIDALKDLNHSLTDKVKDLSTEPSAKPVNVNSGNGGEGNSYTQWRSQMRNMLR